MSDNSEKCNHLTVFNFGASEEAARKALSLFYSAEEDPSLFCMWDTLNVRNFFEKIRRFSGREVPPQHLIIPQTAKDFPAAIVESWRAEVPGECASF